METGSPSFQAANFFQRGTVSGTMDAIKSPYVLWLWIVHHSKATSYTLHFSFTTLLALVFVLLCIVYNAIRSRYLKNYSKLPTESQRKDPKDKEDLIPDHDDPDSKPGLHNYLDEFLSAIKVFGYLERPVFHELTRHLQTKKLLAGETLNLEEEKSFCIVVDGHVQVFFKTNRPLETDGSFEGGDTGDGEAGYRLLTDVRNGSSNSSLLYIHGYRKLIIDRVFLSVCEVRFVY